MDAAQITASVLGTGGGAVVLVALINGFWKWITGRSAQEREDNASAEVQRITAVRDRIAADDRANTADILRRTRERQLVAAELLLKKNGIPFESWDTVPGADPTP